MDKVKLQEIIATQDSIVSMQDLVLVERLTDKYPYCSAFWVLAAKFSAIIKSFNKDKFLQIASVYVSDRQYLKEIISNVSVKQKPVYTPKVKPQKNEDIISEINSYKDEELSVNPTKQELLERFLKIESPKQKIETTQEDGGKQTVTLAIKQSADDDFKIVTETMAKIYAKQGNKAKAVKIYRRLAEENPAKSTYYTHQIELLKNSNN